MAVPFSQAIKAVNNEPVRRVVKYKGEEYEFYSTFLTLGQRDRVKNTQKNVEDANEFALKLLISKALTEDGKKMFQPGQYAELKEDWPADLVEAAMLKLISDEQAEEEEGKD